MPALDLIRHEIDHMRLQVGRHRREMSRLQQAGLDVASTEALVGRIQAKIQELCAQRNRLRKAESNPAKGRVGHRKW